MWGLCSCRHCRNLLLCCRTSSGGGSALCQANGTQHLEATRRKTRLLMPMASPCILQAALPHGQLSLGSAITKPVLITVNKQHLWMQDITTGAIQKPSPSYGLSEQQWAMFKANSQKRLNQTWFGKVTNGQTMSPLLHSHPSQQPCLELPWKQEERELAPFYNLPSPSQTALNLLLTDPRL